MLIWKGESMPISEQIRILCVRKQISVAELSRRLGSSPQNFNSKLKRDRITVYEMMNIADVLNISYHQYFQLENGENV